MLMNFNLLIKLLLFVPQDEDLAFFSLLKGTDLFSVSKFTCSQKKESEKLKNSHSFYFSQFHSEFLQWMSIHYGSTYHNCHTKLLCDHFGQCHCIDHRKLYSLKNTKLRHQIQLFKSSSSPRFEHEAWKRFWHSLHLRSLSDALHADRTIVCSGPW